MIILCNNSHGGIIRVCMGIFTTALRNKKYVKFSKKKYLTLLPQCVACYQTTYFDEKSPFKRVAYFEVFNVHKGFSLSLLSSSCARWSSHSWSLGRLWAALREMAQRNVEWYSVHTNGVALRRIALQNIRRSVGTLNCLALLEIFRCCGESSSLLVQKSKHS